MISEVYGHIYTLPIGNFIRGSETKDTGHLHIGGYKPATKETDEAWSAVLDEYITATAHRGANREIVEAQCAVFALTIEFNNVKILCRSYEASQSPIIAGMLADLGHDVEDGIEVILARNNRLLTEKREAEIALSQMLTKRTGNVSFDVVFDRICTHKKMWLDKGKVTVAEWIAIEDNFITDSLKQKKQ
jgi:hypothetical protein